MTSDRFQITQRTHSLNKLICSHLYNFIELNKIKMTSRNITEVFILMRNNAIQNRNMYDERRPSDSERLLQRSLRDAEEGHELQDDFTSPPAWIDKLEEAQYTISKIKPKLDELVSLHTRHLLRPSLNDKCEEEELIENLSQHISKLISSTHRHTQYIRSNLGQGKKLEQRLTANVVTYLLLALQDVTYNFRNSQSKYLKQLNSREARSNAFFETPEFTTIDLNDQNELHGNAVDSFDNFLKPTTSSAFSVADADYFEQSDEQIDEYFQKSIPQTGRMTQQQLLLFEEENSKMAEHREKEVIKIVQSIGDLHEIFKDLAQMVQEQGTILDRIDYNVEQTHTRVTEGYNQLQKAEMYQRKNRKMYCILVLSSVTLIMMVLLILTKF